MVERVTEERLIKIETKLAHQENLLAELNDVVANQQAQITRLERLCGTLTDRIRSLSDAGSDDQVAEQRPPHY